MFYRVQENMIIDNADFNYSDECKYTDICTTKEYQEDPFRYTLIDGEIVLNPNYEAQQLKKLEKEFDSQFFEIPNFGYFRRIPKGYNSAVESLNTVCSAVTFMKALPQGILTFYNKPDFTKPEQCTEEWITNNSYKNKAMTLDEFAVFYTTFITAWNTQEHL